MRASDFVGRLKEIATEHNTVYAWGMFGSPITRSIVKAKAKQYPSWYTADKVTKVFAPIYGKAWGFDCVGLVKAVLWGWNGDPSKSYGGAVYGSCGVPDVSADAMIGLCSDVSKDFTSLSAGEFLWMKGHCGIYVGGGKVIESTPKWKNGVQITALSDRKWQKHGKLPYVEYASIEEVKTVAIELNVLKKGAENKQVEALQRLLRAMGYSLSVDGEFGNVTDTVVRAYQKVNGLTVDGVVGKNTWRKLLGVE